VIRILLDALTNPAMLVERLGTAGIPGEQVRSPSKNCRKSMLSTDPISYRFRKPRMLSLRAFTANLRQPPAPPVHSAVRMPGHMNLALAEAHAPTGNSAANSPANAWISIPNLLKKMKLSATNWIDWRFLPEIFPAVGKIRGAPQRTCRSADVARILRDAS
jgi:hypothetical protein